MSDSGQSLTINDDGLVTSIGPKLAPIGELTEEIKTLNNLLQDPHPSLTIWRELFSNQMSKVREIITQLGY